MKIVLSGNRVVVELRCRTWELAREVSKANREEPPDGYRMISEFTEDRSPSGNRASLTMTFRHVSRDVPAFSHEEACVFFERDKKTANGGDQVSDVSA